MKAISEYTSDVETLLRDIELPGEKFAGLTDPIRYALSAGGKRLRPVMTLMAAEAFGGDAMRAADAAVGLEIFHNFTLLHDDVMDKSEVRRGRPSVHARFGVNSAILSGDTMLTLASIYINKVEDLQLRRVNDIFNNMALDVYKGQQLDMDFETRDDVTLADYIEMISLKTGALLGAALQIGAVIGGASDKDAGKMYEFGMNVGLAFQIQDDWLDTFGDSITFGKPIGGDIANNKKTYLRLAVGESSGADAGALKMAMTIPDREMKIKTVTRIYEKAGVGDMCRKAVDAYMSKALGALRSTSLDDDRKDTFRRLAEKLVGRKK
ncbi:MAG: polyprenyl synthetase family protein [Bacteroidales bacterium]|nr:polyprenyl synthetase family protein [Bacteroidales bacterium]